MVFFTVDFERERNFERMRDARANVSLSRSEVSFGAFITESSKVVCKER